MAVHIGGSASWEVRLQHGGWGEIDGFIVPLTDPLLPFGRTNHHQSAHIVDGGSLFGCDPIIKGRCAENPPPI